MHREGYRPVSGVVADAEGLLGELRATSVVIRGERCQAFGHKELDSVGQSCYRHGYHLPVLEVMRWGYGHHRGGEVDFRFRRSSAMARRRRGATGTKKHRSKNKEPGPLTQRWSHDPSRPDDRMNGATVAGGRSRRVRLRLAARPSRRRCDLCPPGAVGRTPQAVPGRYPAMISIYEEDVGRTEGISVRIAEG